MYVIYLLPVGRPLGAPKVRPFAPRAARAAPPFRGGRSRQMRFGWDGFYCGSHPGPGAGPELRDRVTELPVRRHTARSPLAPPVLAGRAPCQEERPDQEGPGGPRSPPACGVGLLDAGTSGEAVPARPQSPLEAAAAAISSGDHPTRQAHVEARPSRSASETGLFARSVTPQASAGGPPEAECGGHVSLLPARSPAVSSQPLCTPPTSPDSSSASRRGLRGHSG